MIKRDILLMVVMRQKDVNQLLEVLPEVDPGPPEKKVYRLAGQSSTAAPTWSTIMAALLLPFSPASHNSSARTDSTLLSGGGAEGIGAKKNRLEYA
jgi:hypothetical protein